MADRSGEGAGRNRLVHLDASGPRDVVYCHECLHEWFRVGLDLKCPSCNGNITEIIIPGLDDPRQLFDHESSSAQPRSRRHDHEQHQQHDEAPDPEEVDIDEQFSQGPNGTVIFSRTTRTSNSRQVDGGAHRDSEGAQANNTDHIMREFRNMIQNLIGPHHTQRAPGRPEPEPTFSEPGFHSGTIRFGGGGNDSSGIGGRITFTNTTYSRGLLRPRNTDGPQPEGVPVQDMTSIIENILGPMAVNLGSGEHEGADNSRAGPLGLQTFFSAMLLPINARAGDAVYSQEALDQIISTLMEQTPTSNAPGPASPEAIAALPRKRLDSSLAGSDGKGECSICMDDVKIGDEVVVLPCNHWFDEACVSAWLNEHNTCPICRKGINDEIPQNNRRTSEGTSTARNSRRFSRLSSPRSRGSGGSSSRNEERMNIFLNVAGVNHPEESQRDRQALPSPRSLQRRSSDLADHRVNSATERPRPSRSRSTSGNNGGHAVGSSALNWIRGIQDRLSNNNRRND